MALRDFNKAIADLDHVVDALPSEAKPLEMRADAYARLEKNVLAIADYTGVLALQKKAGSPKVWLKRATVFAKNNDAEAAIGDLTRVIDADPKNVSAWEHRAELHTERDEIMPAIGDLTEAIRLSPRRVSLYRKRSDCLLYTSPSPRDATLSRMPSSA